MIDKDFLIVISTPSLIVIPSEARNLSFFSGQAPGEILLFKDAIKLRSPRHLRCLAMTAIDL